MRKINHIFFVSFIILFLIIGLAKTLFFPEEIIKSENRYANQVENLSVGTYLEGSFQNQLGNALKDQVPYQAEMKRLYNYMTSYYEYQILSCLKDKLEGQYISYKGGRMFDEHLVYGAADFAGVKDSFEVRVSKMKEFVEKYSDIDFYVYYIEKETDVNLQTNQEMAAYEYLRNEFYGTNISFAGFQINNYDQFRKYFYRTDHHWNCYGSYKAYTEIMHMLDQKEEIIRPKDEHILDDSFSGSKSITIGANDVIMEKFPVYEYDYPEMKIKIDGENAEDYGMQEEYLKGQWSEISYALFYGMDYGEIIFDTQRKEKENILVLGSSYDNAILKLLASHYGKTYSIDLRHYETAFGNKFSISKYVEDHCIDKVLVIDDLSSFESEVFLWED